VKDAASPSITLPSVAILTVGGGRSPSAGRTAGLASSSMVTMIALGSATSPPAAVAAVLNSLSGSSTSFWEAMNATGSVLAVAPAATVSLVHALIEPSAGAAAATTAAALTSTMTSCDDDG